MDLIVTNQLGGLLNKSLAVFFAYTISWCGETFRVISCLVFQKLTYGCCNKPETFTLLLGFKIKKKKSKSLQFDNFYPRLSAHLSHTLDTHPLSFLFFQGKVSQKKQSTEHKSDTCVRWVIVSKHFTRGCTLCYSSEFHRIMYHCKVMSVHICTYVYVHM